MTDEDLKGTLSPSDDTEYIDDFFSQDDDLLADTSDLPMEESIEVKDTDVNEDDEMKRKKSAGVKCRQKS